jgi:hypothetical protein
MGSPSCDACRSRSRGGKQRCAPGGVAALSSRRDPGFRSIHRACTGASGGTPVTTEGRARQRQYRSLRSAKAAGRGARQERNIANSTARKASPFCACSSKGVLSGLELSHLDLRGTQIAVLSACETGLGTIRDDEGVYSLRRALAIAGARTQVTTLWSVDDNATKAIMVGFYGQLTKGRGEALRSAQLSLARGKDLRLRHPFFWAGLPLSGDWSPLGAHSTHPPNSQPARTPSKNVSRHFPGAKPVGDLGVVVFNPWNDPL